VPFVCPEDILSVAKDVCANEAQLFAADRASYKNKLGVLQERVRQRENELSEAHANIDRLQQNIDGAQRQYDLIHPLARRSWSHRPKC
jgi:adhesin transport system membrane fusion protein